MKTINEEATANMTEEEVDEFEKQFEWVDWKDINGVFDAFQHQLERHGLEVVYYESGSDSYAFKVEKKTGGGEMKETKEYRVVEYVGDFPLPDQVYWYARFDDLSEAKAVAKKRYDEVWERDAGEEDFETYEVVVQNDDGRVFHIVRDAS